MTGTPSRTARAITVRWCLKEAGGELPARGTRSAYEAWRAWARLRTAPNPAVIRKAAVYMRRVCGRKVTRLTPGDLALCPMRASEAARWIDGAPEVSRSHTRWSDPSKGSTK